MPLLQSDTALVTGAAGGIGRGIADALAGEGARVLRSDRADCDLSRPGAAQELVNALASIRSSALPCEFALPAGDGMSPVDRTRVNLQYTDLAGTQVTIPGVADAASCDATAGGICRSGNWRCSTRAIAGISAGMRSFSV